MGWALLLLLRGRVLSAAYERSESASIFSRQVVALDTVSLRLAVFFDYSASFLYLTWLMWPPAFLFGWDGWRPLVQTNTHVVLRRLQDTTLISNAYDFPLTTHKLQLC